MWVPHSLSNLVAGDGRRGSRFELAFELAFELFLAGEMAT